MIHYIKGDATEPVKKPAVIVHVCNNIGAWGAGFVLALSKKWPQPEQGYRKRKEFIGLSLGDIHLIPVEDDIWVVNLIAQNGIRTKNNTKPLDYDALRTSLMKASEAIQLGSSALGKLPSIHMPRIGCGLAGGEWGVVGRIVEEILKGFEVFVYDL